MKYHTEAGSERRENPYNGGIVGAWSNGGCLRILPEHLLVRMMNGVCPRNIKKPVRYISVALLCHRYLRDSFFPLFSPFLCVLYVVGLLYHSIFRKNQEYCVSLSGKRSFFFSLTTTTVLGKGKRCLTERISSLSILTPAYLISKRALLALQLTPVRASIGR